MDLNLDTTELAFRDEVRAFIEENLTETMREGQRRTTAMYPEPDVAVPWQRALQKRGWLVPLWPMEYGGTGWSVVQRFIFETECALAGAPLVHPMGTRLIGPLLIKHGTREQRERYLPRILSSEDYWCQGFSEPGAGSDLASLSLRAERVGDSYVLNGSKIWTTHAHHANRMFALVRTGWKTRKQEGISFLLIDMSLPGIAVRPIRTIGGDHDVNEVHFTDVRVPVAERVGEEGAGWECAKYLLEFERGAGIFAPRLRGQLKRAVAALHSADTPSEDLLLRFGEVASDLDAFEWLELRTQGGLAAGASPGPISSVLKLRASRLKQAISELAVDVVGHDALHWRTDPSDQRNAAGTLVREYCNSRAFTIFGGAAEVQLGLIAKGILGPQSSGRISAASTRG